MTKEIKSDSKEIDDEYFDLTISREGSTSDVNNPFFFLQTFWNVKGEFSRV